MIGNVINHVIDHAFDLFPLSNPIRFPAIINGRE
jgi:hypothetical protein